MGCHKNGQPVLITTDKEKTEPYRFHMTDVYRCPGCGVKVATGFSRGIERHEDEFEREIKAAGEGLLRVF